MATVTKNRNRIEILVAGKNAPYVFDINTGIMYGLRGKPIKSVTREVMNGICHEYSQKTELERAIYALTDWGKCSNICRLPQYTDILRLADSLDNLEITLNCSNWYYAKYAKALVDDKKLLREYIKYAQKCKANAVHYSFENFKKELEITEFNKKFEIDITDTKYDRIRGTLVNIAKWATPRQLKCYLVNFVYNDFYLVETDRYSNHNAGLYSESNFKQYCEYCDYLDEKVTTKENFLSDYARVYKAYMRQKEEIDTKRFRRAMDIHRAEMEFEYGDFAIVVPTCPQEIKDEGKNMHHCVASYAYECMNTDNPNRSHIVFVRHKDTPEKCYITCEIRNGVIGQYYLSHDRRVTEPTDLAFKSAYQNHLSTMWTHE